MKRRDFFKRVGMAVGAAVLGKEIISKPVTDNTVVRFDDSIGEQIRASSRITATEILKGRRELEYDRHMRAKSLAAGKAMDEHIIQMFFKGA